MSSTQGGARLRPATRWDVPEIFAMINELATFEHAADQVHSSEELLHSALFCDDPAVWVVMCDHIDAHGAAHVAGFALYFRNFFTWTGRHSLYLDDLYVRPEYRGRGYGKTLLRHLATICVDNGWPRLDWWVLHWNAVARDFYDGLGATAMDEWVVYRLTGAPLHDLAAAKGAVIEER